MIQTNVGDKIFHHQSLFPENKKKSEQTFFFFPTQPILQTEANNKLLKTEIDMNPPALLISVLDKRTLRELGN